MSSTRASRLSAGLAPASLVLGFSLAAARQPRFDSAVDTISALAGLAAHERWIMTAALAVLGVCHVVTATGLVRAAWPGRGLLALGGLSTLLVACFPLPRTGTSLPHLACAAVAFGCLAVWPLVGVCRAEDAGLLRARPAYAATAVLLGLLAWLLHALHSGTLIGLAERVVAVAEALWPLLVVRSLRRRSHS